MEIPKIIGTGFTRPVDNLGRVCIPKEIRARMSLNEGDRCDFFFDTANNMLMLGKFSSGCSIPGCKSMEDIVTLDGVTICRQCAKKLVALFPPKKTK